MNTENITKIDDLVVGVANAVRSTIPRTLDKLEEREESDFSLYSLCDSVVHLARDKWPGDFQPGQDLAPMIPFLAKKVADAVREHDLSPARIVEMY